MPPDQILVALRDRLQQELPELVLVVQHAAIYVSYTTDTSWVHTIARLYICNIMGHTAYLTTFKSYCSDTQEHRTLSLADPELIKTIIDSISRCRETISH